MPTTTTQAKTTTQATTTKPTTTTAVPASLYFKPATLIVTQKNDYCGLFIVGYNGPNPANISLRQTAGVYAKLSGGTLKPGGNLPTQQVCLGDLKSPQSVTATAVDLETGNKVAGATMAIVIG
ncbi:MAG: hypothetical protein ACC652_12450 [Acidimicrobiales bacterium]